MANELAKLMTAIGITSTRKQMVNKTLAPKRLVQKPIGTLSSDPRITGTAVAHAIWVDERLISALINGISEEISTQTMKPAIRLPVWINSCFVPWIIQIPLKNGFPQQKLTFSFLWKNFLFVIIVDFLGIYNEVWHKAFDVITIFSIKGVFNYILWNDCFPTICKIKNIYISIGE